MLHRLIQILRQSLLVRLAGFYLLISLPALLLVEIAVLSVEFSEFTRAADAGMLLPALRAESERLGDELAQGVEPARLGDELAQGVEPARLGRELTAWVRVLEHPPSAGRRRGRDVMRELSSEPLRAMLLASDGRVVVATTNALPPGADGWLPLPARWPAAASEIARADAPEWRRLYAAPIKPGDRALLLVLEVRLPLPWRRALFRTGVEWPVLFASLLVFVLGTLVFFNGWVTRRLHRIATAADAWRAGRFAQLIDDRSGDELGQVSRRLDRMAGDLQELVSARARLAQLDERQRLARDLHDTVKQKAFALGLQLAAARAALVEQGQARPAGLDEALTLAGEIQQELALILDQLDGKETKVQGFADRLSQRLAAWARQSGIRLHAELAAADRVAARHHDNLLRLIDEVLANVQRHSGASRVEVRCWAHAGRLGLSISDDGRGLDPAHVPGRGLANLARRAEALPGGRLDFADEPGLTITLSFDDEPE